MEETEVSRRRVSMIAAHFAANDDVSAMATHVLPVVRKPSAIYTCTITLSFMYVYSSELVSSRLI